jgi:alanine racemase
MAVEPAVVDADPDADLRPTWLDVDLGAIAHNVRRLRDHCGPVTFVAALKANAYGFGLVPVARTVIAAGVDAIAVVRVEHAIELRAAGIEVPIILYAGIRPDPRVVAAVVRHQLTVTIVDTGDLRAYSDATPRPIRALVKVDVGLERLGVVPEEAAALTRAVADHPMLELAGVYTHLHVPSGAVADVAPYAEWQFERFQRVLEELDRDGIPLPLRMAVSSGALRLSDTMTLDAIDVGTLLFGLEPPGPTERDLGLRPALVRLSTRLSQVRDRHRTDFPAFSPIPTDRSVRLGVIPMGASDGLLGVSTGQVLIGGRRAKILAISLEHSRIDMTGIDARAGDEVVILGRQGDEAISVRDIATAHDLHSTAFVTVQIPATVARRYVGGADGDAGASAT